MATTNASAYIIETASAAAQADMYNKAISGQIREEYGDTTSGKYLFQSNLTASELNTAVIFKQMNEFNRFFMQAYLNFFKGRNIATPGRRFSWMTQDRPDMGSFIHSVVTPGGGFPANEVKFLSVVRPATFRRVTEVLTYPNHRQYIVTAVTIDVSGREAVTVRRVDGQQIQSGELTPNYTFGYGGNAQTEGSGPIAPGGFMLPEPHSNYTQIIRERMGYTGDAISKETFLSFKSVNTSGFQNYVINYAEAEMMRNFAMAKETAIMWGQESKIEPIKTRGVIPDIMANSRWSLPYTGDATEVDFRNMFENVDVLYDHKKHVALAGRKAFKSFALAFEDRLDEGAQTFGSFSPDVFKTVGVNINGYSFQGRQVVVQEYMPFSDAQTTGKIAPGASVSSTMYDHDYTMLFLNFESQGAGRNSDGSNNSIPYLSYRYNKIAGVDRSLVVGFIKGLTGEGNSGDPAISIDMNGNTASRIRSNDIVSSYDASEIHLLGTVGVELVLPDIAHGIMYKTGN